MTTLTAAIEGIGFWSNGLPDWTAARAFVREGTRPDNTPARPSPQLLAPNERRRAPDTVAVALEVALAACQDAGREPRDLPSVFASTHGDLAITDYMCATLADDPRSISPTRFHNSVHNAAAGYWTIGAGCTQATTAISAHQASFAEGLVEALVQLAAGEEVVLLVAYDGSATGPLASISQSTGVLGGALVLSRAGKPGAPRIAVTLAQGDAPRPSTPLSGLAGDNAMAPMLPMFEALATGAREISLFAGAGRTLQVAFTHTHTATAEVAFAGSTHG